MLKNDGYASRAVDGIHKTLTLKLLNEPKLLKSIAPWVRDLRVHGQDLVS
jgi:hypothetical protein